MAQSENRILATHVGSLVRPPALVAYLQKIVENQPYDAAAYEKCLTDSVVGVVKGQADAGVDIVSDGEYGKSVNWAFYVHRRLGGLESRQVTEEEAKDPLNTVLGGRDREAFPEFYAEYDARMLRAASARLRPAVVGDITYTGQAELQHDIANLKAGLAKVDVAGAFLPVVAPASALPNAKDEHYGDEEKLLFALADALRVEYQAILDAGLTLQVDDAFFPYMYEKMVPPMTKADYRAWAELRIAALNRALEGLPKERTRYHICWGSWNGPHLFDVPMQDIVDILLKVEAGSYSFEAANPRHAHEWKVWQEVKLPPDRILIPGVVSHCTNVVEHPELVAQRLVRYAGIVGRERVMAGTDCGFSQSPLGNRVHYSIMWAKLKALAEGAERATKQLWG